MIDNTRTNETGILYRLWGVITTGAATLVLLGVAPERAHASSCLGNAELEDAFGEEIKAGAFAINTARFRDRPLCSGLTMAQALQRLREKYSPPNLAAGGHRRFDRHAGGEPARARPAPMQGARREPTATSLAWDVEGSWRGTYRCNQGLTGVEITLRPSANERLTGTFSFFPVPTNPRVPTGSFAVTASRQGSGNRVVMTPGAWIKRPPNFFTVSADMTMSNGGQSMGGSVHGSGCTSISLSRSSGPSRR